MPSDLTVPEVFTLILANFSKPNLPVNEITQPLLINLVFATKPTFIACLVGAGLCQMAKTDALTFVQVTNFKTLR